MTRRSVCPTRLMTSEKLRKNRNATFRFHHMEVVGGHWRTGFMENK